MRISKPTVTDTDEDTGIGDLMRTAGTSRPTLYRCRAVPKGSGDLRVAGCFGWQHRHGVFPGGEAIGEVRTSAVHLLVRQQMTAAPLPV